MMSSVGPCWACWALLNPTPNREDPHSEGVGVLGLLGPYRDPSTPNRPPTPQHCLPRVMGSSGEVGCANGGTRVAARKTGKRQALTWAQVSAMEPRLAGLLDTARLVDGSGDHFCANRVWYGTFKPALCELVGWGRKQSPYALTTSGAYDVAYETIYAALPDCRGCWCF